MYDIGDDSAQDCGGLGILARPINKCDVHLLGLIMCDRLWNPIVRTRSDNDCEFSYGVDVSIFVDVVVAQW